MSCGDLTAWQGIGIALHALLALCEGNPPAMAVRGHAPTSLWNIDILSTVTPYQCMKLGSKWHWFVCLMWTSAHYFSMMVSWKITGSSVFLAATKQLYKWYFPSVRLSTRTSQKNNRTSQKNYYQPSRNFWNFLFLLIIPITQAIRCTTGWSDSGCWGADTS